MEQQVKISEKQIEILKVIKDYKEQHGYSPTVRELGGMLGLKSTSSVHAHMKALRDKGYISWIDSIPRTISILKEWS